MTLSKNRVAVLVSGGLDSAVLCVHLARQGVQVAPLFIRSGLRWEDVELACLKRFLAAVDSPAIENAVVLDEPIADVYGEHWSTTGSNIPGATSEDGAVYLPGRNLLLVVKAAVWCQLRGRGALALGSLGTNPFPDSTPRFFEALEAILATALGSSPELIRPFSALHKEDVIALGRDLPLHLTFSCIDPQGGRHCGRCNKCAERSHGFAVAGVLDRTDYAADPLETGR